MTRSKLLFTVGLIIMTIAAALLYLTLRPRTDTSDKTENTNTNAPHSDVQNTTNNPPTKPDGKYIDYSEANFAAARDARRILFFHAPWCPQCRALEKSIQSGNVPTGMVILKTDYGTSSELKQKYGVTLQTTVVEVDTEGNLKKKFVAYDEPSLQAIVKALGE